ncbi:MAG: amidohydrolase family protein [Gammaproteobacteria bacterium]|nr:amidohydrolase family protein [Gammaproteobacteria bacterium]
MALIKNISLLVILTVLFFPEHSVGQVPDNAIVLEGATLISPERGQPLENSVIIVHGDRFQTVTVEGSINYPDNAQVVELDGKFIIPGLVDTHIHYRNWLHDLLLVNGTTSILDLGNPIIWTSAVSEGIEKGKIRGPRMFYTGEHLDLEGPKIDHYWIHHGFLDSWTSGVVLDTSPANLVPDRAIGRHKYFATSPQRGRELVRSFYTQGASAIKVHHSLEPEVLKAVTDEAHQAGIPVVGHRQSAWEVIELGMDFIEHTSPVAIATITDADDLERVKQGRVLDPHHLMDTSAFPGLIEDLIEHNVYFNPTLSGTWRGINHRTDEYRAETLEYFGNPDLKYVPQAYVQKYLDHFSRFERINNEEVEMLKTGYEKVERFINEFSSAGGKLLAGSDPVNTGIPGLGIHREMQLMVDAGVSPLEALKSATIYAAELINKGSDIGTVESGKLADLVVLSGNPLANIENTKDVEQVMLSGKFVDLAFQPDYQIPIPRTEVESIGSSRNAKIFDMLPSTTVAGLQSSVEITFKGQFLPTSVVVFDGIEVDTEFDDPTTIRALLPGDLLDSVGTYSVKVINPVTGGDIANSNTVYFLVKYP